MSFRWNKVVLGTLAALALGSAAQASEVTVTVRTNDSDWPQRIADYGGERFGRGYGENRYEHRDPDRYYGRPVPEWRERRHHHSAHRSIPVVERHEWHRPVFAEPRWGYRENCKIIIKERINRWGEEVQVRRKVCR